MLFKVQKDKKAQKHKEKKTERQNDRRQNCKKVTAIHSHHISRLVCIQRWSSQYKVWIKHQFPSPPGYASSSLQLSLFVYIFRQNLQGCMPLKKQMVQQQVSILSWYKACRAQWLDSILIHHKNWSSLTLHVQCFGANVWIEFPMNIKLPAEFIW